MQALMIPASPTSLYIIQHPAHRCTMGSERNLEILTDTPRNRDTDLHTETLGHIQTHRHTDTQKDIDTHTETQLDMETDTQRQVDTQTLGNSHMFTDI